MNELDNPFLALFDQTLTKSRNNAKEDEDEDETLLYRQHYNDVMESVLAVTLNQFNPHPRGRIFME